MTVSPLVSVICTCYNHAMFVEEALLSVINQSYKNIELIVIDNGSVDDSKSKLLAFQKQYPDVKLIFHPKNIGSTKAFNDAVLVAKGEYLIDLAADDVLLPHCVASQIEILQHNESAAIVFGNAQLIDKNGQFLGYFFDVDHDKKVIDKALFTLNFEKIVAGGNIMCSVSAMMNRRIFNYLNGYNEQLVFEDLDYWLRATIKFEIIFSDEIWVKRRMVAQSQSAHFQKKSDYSKKINHSMLLIMRMVFKICNSKNEYYALLKRIHYQMKNAYRLHHWKLLMQFLILKLKTEIKIARTTF